MGRQGVTGDENWVREYVLLTLRVGKAVQARTGDDWMLDFFGPPEWKALVDAGEPEPGGALLDATHAAGETLSRQGFETGRTGYLSKHLRALSTVARRLAGEHLSLIEQAAGCFDLDAGWVPEGQFAAAGELLDEALPGRGPTRGRLTAWKRHHELQPGNAHLLPALFEQAILEARRRTDEILGLPEGEEVAFGSLDGGPFLALAEYLGGLRSRVLVNTQRPFNVADLLYVACHEGYPGHLAEIVLKEKHLASEKGYAEELVSFLPTPRFVVSEGLALWAREVAFPESEQLAWLEEHAYPQAGLEPEGDPAAIHTAKDLLWGVQCNAALMFDEGRPEKEVIRYLERWAFMDEEEARRALPSLRRPFTEAYIFCYHHGRMVLEPGMSGPGRDAFVRRLLTEQVLPSDLRAPSARGESG